MMLDINSSQAEKTKKVILEASEVKDKKLLKAKKRQKRQNNQGRGIEKIRTSNLEDVTNFLIYKIEKSGKEKLESEDWKSLRKLAVEKFGNLKAKKVRRITQNFRRNYDYQSVLDRREFIVTYKKDTLENPKKDLGLKSTKKLQKTGNIILAKVQETEDPEIALRRLKSHPGVESVQPNFKYTVQIDSNDTEKDKLWGLENTGQMVNLTSGVIDADIDAPEAWSISEGDTAEVLVGVLDTGVAYNHPDLNDNVWSGSECLDKDGTSVEGGCPKGFDTSDDDFDAVPVPLYTFSGDISDHGTHIAGTIAAEKGNEAGVIGVAPNAKVVPIRASFASDIETLFSSDIVEGLAFAEANEIKIINASFGDPSNQTCAELEDDVWDEALYNAISEYSGLFVAAAGNDASLLDAENGYKAPASFGKTTACWEGLENIISVAATDNQDQLASFSNFGATQVDVAAPGVDIFSTVYGEAKNTLFSENFESLTPSEVPANVTIDSGDWGTTDFGGSIQLKTDVNNEPYLASQDTSVVFPTIDLSGNSNPVYLDFDLTCDTEYELENIFDDYLALDFRTNGTYNQIGRFDEESLELQEPDPADNDGTGTATARQSEYVWYSDRASDFAFRFRWVTDEDTDTGSAGQGCFVDNIELYEMITTPDGSAGGTYDYKSGTSMAAPHVVGQLALMQGHRPYLTQKQLKEILLSTGDTLTSLQGKTITGKRINAHNALSTPAVKEVKVGVVDGTYGTNEILPIEVVFDEAVNIGASTPQIRVAFDDETTQIIDYTSGDGTDTLVFEYTIHKDDASERISSFDIDDLIVAEGTSIIDLANYVAHLDTPVPGSENALEVMSNIVIETPPLVTVIPENNSIDVATDALITLNFDEPIRNIDSSAITNENVKTLITLEAASGTEVQFAAIINDQKNQILITPENSLAAYTTYRLVLAPVAESQGFATEELTVMFGTLFEPSIQSVSENDFIGLAEAGTVQVRGLVEPGHFAEVKLSQGDVELSQSVQLSAGTEEFVLNFDLYDGGAELLFSDGAMIATLFSGVDSESLVEGDVLTATLDTIAPDFTILSPATSSEITQFLNIEVQTESSNTYCDYRLNSGDWEELGVGGGDGSGYMIWYQQIDELPVGANVMEAYCEDQAGNAAPNQLVTWTVRNDIEKLETDLSLHLDKGNVGVIELPEGVSEIEFEFDFSRINLDTKGVEVSADQLGIDGESLDLTDYNRGDLTGVDLSAGINLNGESFTVTNGVKLKSGTDGVPIVIRNQESATGATVTIPDDTIVLTDKTYTETIDLGGDSSFEVDPAFEIAAPTERPAEGRLPSGYRFKNTNSFFVGAHSTDLFFDRPVELEFLAESGSPAFKLSVSENWNLMSVCGGEYESPIAPVFPRSCAIQNGADTKILTYHFTDFGFLAQATIQASTPETEVVSEITENVSEPLKNISGGGSVSKSENSINYYNDRISVSALNTTMRGMKTQSLVERFKGSARKGPKSVKSLELRKTNGAIIQDILLEDHQKGSQVYFAKGAQVLEINGTVSRAEIPGPINLKLTSIPNEVDGKTVFGALMFDETGKKAWKLKGEVQLEMKVSRKIKADQEVRLYKYWSETNTFEPIDGGGYDPETKIFKAPIDGLQMLVLMEA